VETKENITPEKTVKKPGKPTLKIVSSSSSKHTGTRPPRKLGPHGDELWRTIMNEFDISDSGGIEILAQVCAALDRVEAQQEIIDDEGETITTKSGTKSHPLLREQLAGRAFITRNLQRLGVLDQPIKPIGRPPGR
jgi:hypothetical protein